MEPRGSHGIWNGASHKLNPALYSEHVVHKLASSSVVLNCGNCPNRSLIGLTGRRPLTAVVKFTADAQSCSDFPVDLVPVARGLLRLQRGLSRSPNAVHPSLN